MGTGPELGAAGNGGDVDAMLQTALQRLALLAEATDALSSTLDGREALRRLCRVLLPQLADWCAADLLDGRGRPSRVVVEHFDTARPTAHLQGPLPDVPQASADPLARVLRGAGPLVADPEAVLGADDASAWHAAQVTLFTALHAKSAVIAPLRARRQVLGALTLARSGDQLPLTADDLDLIEDLAHRTALAVDNARLYASVQDTAEHLQRSLLPGLPDLAPLTVAARYLPARSAAEVGGDWYDCFRLPDGSTALIIGDVTGHDLPAAVSMGQLRNMLRALACDRQGPPGDILRRLDLAIETLYGDRTATSVYARLTSGSDQAWTLDYANAGHPPPLLITPEGDARYLTAGHSVLLGVDPHTARPSGRQALTGGSTVLLYTDGLIERPGEHLDTGLERLRQHGAALAREDIPAFLDELLAGLARNSSDDIAVLAVRLPPAS
ncbi:PP2C family protein-serine/threonine phosphatase [Streptomyces yangpuensis]|uniref:PP2C family protein-serine/threonine phosphatase n=1 Tax=Streptomyces yangpuensis TaxID=1648182 RepID=UPI00382C5FB8